MEIEAPTVINCQGNYNQQEVEQIISNWFIKSPNTLGIPSTYLTEKYIDEAKTNWGSVSLYVELLEKKLKHRLHDFLKIRLPLQRPDLLPGRH